MADFPITRSVGIVVALTAEARALTNHRVRPERITKLADNSALWLSGMGPLAATRAAHALAEAGAQALAIFGVAGALDARLRNGDLVCPQHIVDTQYANYSADPAWRNRLLQCLRAVDKSQIHAGVLLSVDAALTNRTQKAAAQQRHTAIAADMESVAVAAVAAQCSLPFLALRAIVDELDDTIPAELLAGIDPFGRARTLPLFAALARRPTLLAALPKLSARMRHALAALRGAAKLAGPNLCWTP